MIPRIDILMLHIPDGFLSTGVVLAGWVLALVAIGLALRQTREQFGERQIGIETEPGNDKLASEGLERGRVPLVALRALCWC